MVFDPISLVGIVGLSLGAFNFILSGISGTATRAEDYRTYYQQVETYKQRLDLCDHRLRQWLKKWCALDAWGQRHISEESQILLWSLKGFRDIQRRLESIACTASTVGEILKLEDPDTIEISYRDETDYEVSLHTQTKLSLLIETMKVTWDKSIKVIYEFDRLDKLLTRLSQQVRDLADVADDYFWSDQLEADKGEVTSEYLQRLIVMSEVRKSLDAFMSNLHNAIKDEDQPQNAVHKPLWAIELRPPDLNESLDRLDTLSQFLLDFTVAPAHTDMQVLPNWWIRHRVSWVPEMFAGLPVEGQQRLASRVRDFIHARERDMSQQEESGTEILTRPLKYTETVKRHLQAVESAARSLANRRNRITDAEILESFISTAQQVLTRSLRIYMALGLANWMLLLWATPWFRKSCSCLLQTVIDEKQTDHQVFWCLDDSQMPPHECDDVPAGCTHLFRLGHILAELALSRPLLAVSTTEFRASDGTPLSLNKVLDMVTTATGDGYDRIVRNCFDYDQRIRRRKDTHLRAQDLLTLHRTIIQRLEALKVLCDRHHRARRRVSKSNVAYEACLREIEHSRAIKASLCGHRQP